jgi:hypothetical protein
MMPRIITIDVKPDDRLHERMLERMARQNRALYGNALLDRTRRLNQDAIEAAERIHRVIESLGGFEAIEAIQRVRDFARRLEVTSPGSLALMELLEPPNKENKADLDRARKSFSWWIDPKPIDHNTRQRLSEISKEQGKHHLLLLRQSIFPEALMLVIADVDRPQTIRIGRKWIKRRDGKKALVRPADLPWHRFVHWVQRECCKAAAAIILGYEYPANPREPANERG